MNNLIIKFCTNTNNDALFSRVREGTFKMEQKDNHIDYYGNTYGEVFVMTGQSRNNNQDIEIIYSMDGDCLSKWWGYDYSSRENI